MFHSNYLTNLYRLKTKDSLNRKQKILYSIFSNIFPCPIKHFNFIKYTKLWNIFYAKGNSPSKRIIIVSLNRCRMSDLKSSHIKGKLHVI